MTGETRTLSVPKEITRGLKDSDDYVSGLLYDAAGKWVEKQMKLNFKVKEDLEGMRKGAVLT